MFRASMSGAVIAVLLGALGCIQLASDAFAASAAAPASLPAHIPIGMGLRVYAFLDRVTPAPYVESTLAAYELQRGSTAAAERYALRLPPNAVRNELLGRIALARGNRVLAFEYFFAAPDVAALQSEVMQDARKDPQAAYGVERRIRERLIALQTHPDAVAEAYWTLGVLASECADRLSPANRRRALWLRRGLRDETNAAELSPLSEKYALSAGTTAAELGDVDVARRWFRRVLEIDPGSIQGLAGIRSLENMP